MSDDLPLPATPVTTVKDPSGIRAVMFLRLCARQPLIVSHFWSDPVRTLPFLSAPMPFRPVR